MTPVHGFCGSLRPQRPGASARWYTATLPLRAVGPADAPTQGAAAGTCNASAWSDAGDVGLAWHGEIYNAPDLCRQLGIAPDTPVPQLLLAAWRRWSLDFLPRLDGVFALALRDGERLVLSRDPSGLRNLYVYIGRAGEVAFATHLPSLLRLPGTERRLSRRSLHEYLRFLDIAAPNTLFEDVRAVEAGQLFCWSPAGTEASPWPGSDAGGAVPASFGDAVDALDEHLQRSVRTRLAGSSRPGAFLSGGIDSSLLCAIAARQRGDVTAVTVGFEGAAYDEAPVAQRIAAHLGLTHEVLRFSRGEYLTAFEALSQHLEQPMADPATPATVLAYGHCRSHFDTVLDGMGADEAVGAMPPRHVRLAAGYASLLPPRARGGLTRLLRAVPGLSGYAPILDFEHPADTMIRWRGFTRPEIESLCGEPVSFAHTTFYRTFDGFLRQAHYRRYSALMNAMPCERLNQATLITGARIRYPFWDRETDRFIRQLPIDFRFLPQEPKRVLRALLARYVPRSIWEMPKHSFDFPLWEFLSAADFQLVRRYLDPDLWRQARVLADKQVWLYARRFMGGDQSLKFRVWALVVLGAWLEKRDKLH
jgi:asparagine synthase (glutamine-hydrolysing)